MNYDHNNIFGLFKFQSGYRKFCLNSRKGYSRKIINAQTGWHHIVPFLPSQTCRRGRVVWGQSPPTVRWPTPARSGPSASGCAGLYGWNKHSTCTIWAICIRLCRAIWLKHTQNNLGHLHQVVPGYMAKTHTARSGPSASGCAGLYGWNTHSTIWAICIRLCRAIWLKQTQYNLGHLHQVVPGYMAETHTVYTLVTLGHLHQVVPGYMAETHTVYTLVALGHLHQVVPGYMAETKTVYMLETLGTYNEKKILTNNNEMLTIYSSTFKFLLSDGITCPISHYTYVWNTN